MQKSKGCGRPIEETKNHGIQVAKEGSKSVLKLLKRIFGLLEIGCVSMVYIYAYTIYERNEPIIRECYLLGGHGW